MCRSCDQTRARPAPVSIPVTVPFPVCAIRPVTSAVKVANASAVNVPRRSRPATPHTPAKTTAREKSIFDCSVITQGTALLGEHGVDQACQQAEAGNDADGSDFVDKLVADGRMPADDRIVIGGRSAFRDVASCQDLSGLEPRLFFQLVPESKVAKNRVHLDIHVEPDRKLAEVERLEKLGARLIDSNSDRGPVTYVMHDPEGNEFCLH